MEKGERERQNLKPFSLVCQSSSLAIIHVHVHVLPCVCVHVHVLTASFSSFPFFLSFLLSLSLPVVLYARDWSCTCTVYWMFVPVHEDGWVYMFVCFYTCTVCALTFVTCIPQGTSAAVVEQLLLVVTATQEICYMLIDCQTAFEQAIHQQLHRISTCLDELLILAPVSQAIPPPSFTPCATEQPPPTPSILDPVTPTQSDSTLSFILASPSLWKTLFSLYTLKAVSHCLKLHNPNH